MASESIHKYLQMISMKRDCLFLNGSQYRFFNFWVMITASLYSAGKALIENPWSSDSMFSNVHLVILASQQLWTIFSHGQALEYYAYRWSASCSILPQQWLRAMYSAVVPLPSTNRIVSEISRSSISRTRVGNSANSPGTGPFRHEICPDAHSSIHACIRPTVTGAARS